MDAHTHTEEAHISPYSFYVKVWVILLILTALTVAVTHVNLRQFSGFAALVIATIKAGIVMLFFMHVRYDKPVIAVMIGVTLAEYLIFIFLTFSDYVYR
jgi:cytochrome c oxidase subunit 4